jgi:tripartite-type tricarboxylate transporter receptor subunit TctC
MRLSIHNLLRCSGLVFSALLLAVSPASAEKVDDWPSNSVRIVVPFAPGALLDSSTRLLADHLTQKLGQPFIVENVPGAGGVVGTVQVANAPADGSRFLLAPDSVMLVSPRIYKQQPYNPETDFVPISKFGVSTLLIVAQKDKGISSIPELLEKAKSDGGLVYGTSGVGTNTHVIMELLKDISGADLTHVPYKGGAPALTDLIGGRIDLVSTTPASAIPHIKSGRLVGVAVTTQNRFDDLPEVSAIAEHLPQFSYNSWLGVFAPAGTPQPIIDKLNTAINEIAESDSFKSKLKDMGVIATTSNPKSFMDEIKQDFDKYGPLIKKADIRAD